MGKQSSDSLFTMTDFRDYIRAWARAKGRGAYRQIASALTMHTTLVSQVLNGRKCFTEEQAAILCGYMGLNLLETDYFLKLVQIERAGNQTLKTIYSRQLQHLKKQANEIKSRVPESQELTNQDRALFYSSWQYSLVRLLTGIERFQRAEDIARQLDLSVSRVQEILDFLISRGLCKVSNSRYTRTEKNTHIDANSALVVRHHQNWRSKSLGLLEQITLEDLAFTAPISLAQKDFPKIRAILLEAISDISKTIEESPSEDVAYLGIDWFKI
jgi:uncharacterized protein (TIGR02147 family)